MCQMRMKKISSYYPEKNDSEIQLSLPSNVLIKYSILYRICSMRVFKGIAQLKSVRIVLSKDVNKKISKHR